MRNVLGGKLSSMSEGKACGAIPGLPCPTTVSFTPGANTHRYTHVAGPVCHSGCAISQVHTLQTAEGCWCVVCAYARGQHDKTCECTCVCAAAKHSVLCFQPTCIQRGIAPQHHLMVVYQV